LYIDGVSGTRARRSPGSTLKPFIYALALDAGLIQPQTLLDDAPRRFARGSPENSDRQFLGPISASEALRRSRNIPAIEPANRLPGGGLEAFLRSSGVDLPQLSHGLVFVIGATEMPLEDLAMLYEELAYPKQGSLPRRHTRQGDPQLPAKRVNPRQGGENVAVGEAHGLRFGRDGHPGRGARKY